VPDAGDRFRDLGPREDESEAQGPSAAERLAAQDRAETPPEPPKVPRPGSRYAWVVGIAFLLAIIVAGVNSVSTEGPGAQGPEPGSRLPVFAAPLATGDLEGDANVRQGASGSEAAGPIPACEVRSPDVVNLCELRRRPLVLTLIFTRGADCEPQLDRVERVWRAFPRVNFAAVFSGESREDIEPIVRRRGWGFPVAVDPDGGVTNLYGVGGCPTTVFSFPGGRVMDTKLGNLTEDQLSATTRRLLRRGRQRERARSGAGEA
jgi:hypothetical protein